MGRDYKTVKSKSRSHVFVDTSLHEVQETVRSFLMVTLFFFKG